MVEREVLLELLKMGLSTRQIARKLDFSPSNIEYWEHKHGLRPAFGPHGKGRKTKTPEQSAAQTVRESVEHRRRLKARAIAYKGGKCILCGYSRCNTALEFRHPDKSTKTFGLCKKGLITSWSSIMKELDKCVLICANCHREVEAGFRTIANETLGESK